MNKKMSLRAATLVLLISSIMTTQLAHTSTMISCIMQFPALTKQENMPHIIRAYTCGKKVPYSFYNVDTVAKRLSFFVPLNNKNTVVHLVITEKVFFEQNKENIINYLKTPENQSYKYYKMLFSVDANNKNDNGTWIVKESQLNEKGQIPDDAVIICYDPSCIDSVIGGNTFELPTINLKHDAIALCDPLKSFTDLANTSLLASLDSDTIHSSIAPNIQIGGKSPTTTIIATS